MLDPALLEDAAATVGERGAESMTLKAERPDAGLEVLDVEAGEARDEFGRGLLEVLPVAEHRDAERLDLLGQEVLDDRERLRRVARDEHALALREEVAEKVRDGVGLARAGRPLHEHDVVVFDLVRDRELLGVRGLGEKYVGVLARRRGEFGFERKRGREARGERREDVGTDDLHQVRGHVAVFGDVLPDAADRTANAARTRLNQNDGTRLEREGGLFTRTFREFFSCGHEAAVGVKACGELFERLGKRLVARKVRVRTRILEPFLKARGGLEVDAVLGKGREDFGKEPRVLVAVSAHFDHGQVAAARSELDDERLHEERPAHGVLRARDVGVRREDGRADHALVAKVRLGEMVPQILQALEERMVGKNLASGLQPGAADPEPVGERLVEFGRLGMLGRIGQGLPVGRPFGGAPVARRVRGERLGNRRARRHLELFDAADEVGVGARRVARNEPRHGRLELGEPEKPAAPREVPCGRLPEARGLFNEGEKTVDCFALCFGGYHRNCIGCRPENCPAGIGFRNLNTTLY